MSPLLRRFQIFTSLVNRNQGTDVPRSPKAHNVNANETKSENETGRKWWEVDGWNDISDEERETIREDAKAVDAAILEADDEKLTSGFENAKPEVERLGREAREALVRYRVVQRYVEAVRQRLRGTPRSDGNSAADEVAAGPGHRSDSAGSGPGTT